MAAVEFERREETLELLNPLKGFARDSQQVEVRQDPLLAHTSVYNPLIESGLKIFVGAVDRGLIQQLAAKSAADCFFCPGKIVGTAKFTEDLVAGGRVQVGEAQLFPNLFSLAKHHAVVVISRTHFLELAEFTSELIGNAFRAIHQYVSTVFRQDATVNYVSANANYLFPAGASLMHPHFQVLVTSQPYTHQLRLSQACRQHFSLHGSAYHEDLVETERALGERYVGRTGAWHWLAAYAPMGSNEIIAVHEHTGDFVQLSGEDLHALAAGLSGVLRLYEHLGYLSFNFTLYARRDSGVPDGFNCLMRCITRQNPYPNYRADDFFLQKGLETELIVELPEDLASAARNYVGVEMTKPGSSNV